MNNNYIDELEKALNPRKWDQELNDAWHRSLPDLQKAFDAIKNVAINRSKRNRDETHN